MGLGRPIFAFVDTDSDGISEGNVISIDITACQDPDENPDACGTTRNPWVNLSTRVNLRATSIR